MASLPASASFIRQNRVGFKSHFAFLKVLRYRGQAVARLVLVVFKRGFGLRYTVDAMERAAMEIMRRFIRRMTAGGVNFGAKRRGTGMLVKNPGRQGSAPALRARNRSRDRPFLCGCHLHARRGHPASLERTLFALGKRCGKTSAAARSRASLVDAGENFASLESGTSFWYPKGVQGPFDESFRNSSVLSQQEGGRNALRLSENARPGRKEWPARGIRRRSFSRQKNA